MKVGWYNCGLTYRAETAAEQEALVAQGEAAIAAGASPLWDFEELARQGRETKQWIMDSGLEGRMVYAGPGDGRDELREEAE